MVPLGLTPLLQKRRYLNASPLSLSQVHSFATARSRLHAVSTVEYCTDQSRSRISVGHERDSILLCFRERRVGLDAWGSRKWVWLTYHEDGLYLELLGFTMSSSSTGTNVSWPYAAASILAGVGAGYALGVASSRWLFPGETTRTNPAVSSPQRQQVLSSTDSGNLVAAIVELTAEVGAYVSVSTYHIRAVFPNRSEYSFCLPRLLVYVKPLRLRNFFLVFPPLVAPRGEEEVLPTLYPHKETIQRATKITLNQSEPSCEVYWEEELIVLCHTVSRKKMRGKG